MEKAIRVLDEPERGSTRNKKRGAAYDTAWAARIINERGKPVFPECVGWLRENQRKDGSWGSCILNYHDRILSTLSSIIALREIGGNKYSIYIQKGEAYIWENIGNINQDTCRLIGSELLFPSLMQEAESMGLNVPSHVKLYQEECEAKLRKVDKSLWYSPLTTLSFSLEFLGDNVDEDQLPMTQLPNGSIGNSPAATAFFLRYKKNTEAITYLRKVLSLTGDGSIMTVYPTDVFEYGWTMYNLMLADLYFEQYTDICDYLLDHMGRSGLGPSVESPVPDADDTAVVSKILHAMGCPVDAGTFDPYDAGDYYLTFNFESDASVSTNVHVLDFVKSCTEFPNREDVIERLIRFLKREMHSQEFWMDKWHISPYYPTSHAVFALCDIEPTLTEQAISWIFGTQNDNGTWGYNGGTLEETSYCMQALLYYHQKVDHIDLDSVSRAFSYFDHNLQPFLNILPELWIGKVLYCPKNVILSSIVSASTMYNTSVWKLCSGWSA
jgi:halimadienyl-diphosphate synthase